VVQLIDQFGNDISQAGVEVILKATYAPDQFTDLVGDTQVTTLSNGTAPFPSVYFDKEYDGSSGFDCET